MEAMGGVRWGQVGRGIVGGVGMVMRVSFETSEAVALTVRRGRCYDRGACGQRPVSLGRWWRM